MRRIMVALVVVMLVSTVAGAQSGTQREDNTLTLDELAVLFLRYGQPQVAPPGPAESFTALQEIGLFPPDYNPSDVVTHGVMSDILGRVGIVYTPASHEAPISPAFAESLLRRGAFRIRDYSARRLGIGSSLPHILDEGVDRAVSPMDFTP
jgi:hypothetical protein